MPAEFHINIVGHYDVTDAYSIVTEQQNWTYNASNVSIPADGTNHALSYLTTFNKWYQGVHGYLSIVVCVFGILSNIINIVVLTRKPMLTPTNCILTAIAVADMMTMLSYLPFAAYFYCVTVLDQEYGHPRYDFLFLYYLESLYCIILHIYIQYNPR